MNCKNLDITPRLMWNENSGYCGETAFICAGMYYGQYCSQYYMRTLAYGQDGNSQETCQLLLGENDTAAAQNAGLAYIAFNAYSPGECMAWIKQQIVAGYPVALGLYMNESIFGSPPGDPQYDHIVLVTGIQSNHDLNDGNYYPDDVIIYSDHGLYTPYDNGNPPFIYAQVCREFVKDREQANDPSAPVYSLPKKEQFAGAFTGSMGLSLYLRSATNSELPEINGNTQPHSFPLMITAYIDSLDAAGSYQLTDKAGAVTLISGVTTWSQLFSIHSGDVASYTLVKLS